MNAILNVDQLNVEFKITANRKWPWSPPQILRAVNGVSFQLEKGKTLGVVGESGCGKSTLARAIVRLVDSASGSVNFDGKDITTLSRSEMRPIRQRIQMVFQDPQSSLNPRQTIGEILDEPLRQFFTDLDGPAREKRVKAMLERVGILSNAVSRYPHEFSGGQCQRIGIARALITEPDLLICDEPVSALDVSVQAQVVNLLGELQDEMGLAMIFVAHDVGVVHHISDDILVMYLGQAVEYQKADDLIRNPRHPYTQALLSAVPIADPKAKVTPQILDGDLPSPLALPKGCAFSTRCPYARDHCKETRPTLEPVAGQEGFVNCFYWDQLKG